MARPDVPEELRLLVGEFLILKGSINSVEDNIDNLFIFYPQLSTVDK